METEKINNEIIPPDLQAKVDAWSKDRQHLSPIKREELANDVIIGLYQRCSELKIDALQAQIGEHLAEDALIKLKSQNTLKK